MAVLEAGGRLVEAVRVKPYSSDLTLSSFSPEKEGSFSHRVVSLCEVNGGVRVTVASFRSTAALTPDQRQPSLLTIRQAIVYGGESEPLDAMT